MAITFEGRLEDERVIEDVGEVLIGGIWHAVARDDAGDSSFGLFNRLVFRTRTGERVGAFEQGSFSFVEAGSGRVVAGTPDAIQALRMGAPGDGDADAEAAEAEEADWDEEQAQLVAILRVVAPDRVLMWSDIAQAVMATAMHTDRERVLMLREVIGLLQRGRAPHDILLDLQRRPGATP